jgi:hypothetical protein
MVLDIAKVIEVKVSDIQHKVHKFTEKKQKGVYVLLDERQRPLYVGRGTLRERLPFHLNNKDLGHNYHWVRIIFMKKENDIIPMEKILIDTLNPIFNISGRLYMYSEKPKNTAEYNKRIQRQMGVRTGISMLRRRKEEESGINESYSKGFEIGLEMGYDKGFDEGYDAGCEFRNKHKNLF